MGSAVAASGLSRKLLAPQPGVTRGRPSTLLTGCVPYSSYPFDSDQRATRYHLIQDRQQTLDVCLVVNDFNQDREIA